MKLVKEKLYESFGIGGHHYEVIKTKEGLVKAGKEGILGSHDNHISWDTIKKLMNQFNIE